MMISATDRDLEVLKTLLNHYLPAGIRAYAFGSRTRKECRSGSDLDILLEASSPIPWNTLAELEEALADSDLPFRVDLLDREKTSAEFLQRIDNDKVPLL